MPGKEGRPMTGAALFFVEAISITAWGAINFDSPNYDEVNFLPAILDQQP
jgi:hypothetical protein